MEYRTIKGFEKYLIYSNGSIFSIKSGRFLEPTISRNTKYLRITMSKDSEPHHFFVHSLICEAFHGKRPDGMQCCHLNGNSKDNRASNLKWGSSKENTAHKKVHGTATDGEKHPMAKLTIEQVNSVFPLRKDGYTFKQIAKKLGINQSTVSRIFYKTLWRNETSHTFEDALMAAKNKRKIVRRFGKAKLQEISRIEGENEKTI